MTGSTSATITSKAWLIGSPEPAWQVAASDSSSARIAQAGAVGGWFYCSATTPSLVLDVVRVQGWRLAPDTVTSSPPAAGSAALGSTSYFVPSGATFVSPAGSDLADGTSAHPFATLATAISAAASGATIVLRAGSYHESVAVPSTKTVTIQSYPGEAVWLDGSVRVTGWRSSGTRWIHDGWATRFTASSGSGYVSTAYPMAGHPDQMWMDGKPLRQVGSTSAVTAGTFYADYGNQALVLGTDPSGHELRASDLAIAATVSSPNSTVRGIGVRRYANNVADVAALRMTGTGSRVQNVVVSDNATVGLAVTRVGARVQHVTARRNGQLGIVANYADGILVEAVLADLNNAEHFNRAPVSGGVKITRTRGITVRDNLLTGNDGPGLWLDESCYNAVVVGNHLTDNVGHGMSFEISDTAIIADNYVMRNGGYGLKINDSGHVQIWNNVIQAGRHDVFLVQDARRNANLSDPGHDPRQPQPDPTMPWIVNRIVVANNVLAAPPNGYYDVAAFDASGEFTAADMHITVNGNRLANGPTGGEFLWSFTPGTTTVLSTVSAYTKATGDGQLNTESSATPLSADGLSGLALPSDVAAALGVPAGLRTIGCL